MKTILAILIYTSPRYSLLSFESAGLSVHVKKLKIDFSIFSSDGYLIHWSGTCLAILIKSYLGTIPVKFE